MPVYAGYAVDITLLWAIRRRRRTYTCGSVRI